MKTQNVKQPDFLTNGEAARALGVSISTLYNYERMGKIPALRTARGLRLYLLCDVEKLAEEMRNGSARRGGRANGSA